MVEHATVFAPEADRVTALALIVETVEPRDRYALVVAAKHVDHLWELDFIRHEEAHGFNTLLATVDEVANEQELVDRWGTARDLKQPQHIIILAVEIARDFDGRFELEQSRLRLEDLLTLANEPFNGTLMQINKSVHLHSFGLVQLVKNHIHGESLDSISLWRVPLLHSLAVLLDEAKFLVVAQFGAADQIDAVV